MTQEELDFFKNNLSYLYEVYTIFHKIRDDFCSQVQYPGLFQVLSSSLGRNLVLGLAALTDPVEQLGNQNLSIYLFADVDLSPHEKAVSKVRQLRKKFVGHNDRKLMPNANPYIQGIDLKFEETKKLIDYLIDIVEKVVGEFQPSRTELEEDVIATYKRIFIDRDVDIRP